MESDILKSIFSKKKWSLDHTFILENEKNIYDWKDVPSPEIGLKGYYTWKTAHSKKKGKEYWDQKTTNFIFS
jgi:hypothetical protein